MSKTSEKFDPSEWEYVADNAQQPIQQQNGFSSSDWTSQPPQESLLYSIASALPRIGMDVGQSLYHGAKQIPGMLAKAPQELSGLPLTNITHPLHSAGQLLAGGNELINALAQSPKRLSEYGENRLHLVPHSVSQAISNITPEDTTGAINQLFGEPKYAGEATLRGAIRDIPQLLGGYGALKVPGAISEFLTPNKFAQSQLNRIYKSAKEAKNEMQSNFNAALNPYINQRMQIKEPKEYLGFNKNGLSDEAKNLYDDFIENPNVNTLHNLQSKMGADASSLRINDPYKYQRVKAKKEKVMGLIQDYLSKNPQHLENYNKAKNIGRDIYYPYTSSENLSAIEQGLKEHLTPKELENIIQKGKETELYRKDGQSIPEIPEGHLLRSIQEELRKKVKRGNKAKAVLKASGAAAGALGTLGYLHNKFNENR